MTRPPAVVSSTISRVTPAALAFSLASSIRLGSMDDVGTGQGATAAHPGASIGADDVLDMHIFLAGYRGDLRGLVGPAERGRPDTAGAA